MTGKEFLQTLGWLAFMLVCGVSAFTIGDVIHGGWGTAAALVSALLVFSAIIALVEHMARSASEARLRRRYGMVSPERLPMGRVLLVQHRSGAILDLSKDAAFFALGRGEEKLFLLKHKANAVNKQRGGNQVSVSQSVVEMPFAAITDVDLVELSQAEIENNAKDNRAWDERAGEAIAARLTGVKFGKIIPYACFLDLRADQTSEIARIVAAYPTEIDGDSLDLAQRGFEHVSDKIVGMVQSEAGEAAKSAIGIDAVEVINDVNSLLLNPGRASGSTRPDQARLVGRMVRDRIRHLVGANNDLSSATVQRAAG